MFLSSVFLFSLNWDCRNAAPRQCSTSTPFAYVSNSPRRTAIYIHIYFITIPKTPLNITVHVATMAKASFFLIPLFLLFILALFSTRAATIEGLVGGRTMVKDVKTNKELQDLGKYCVEEYNRKLQHTARITKLLTFSQVVEAEKQVVSGIKYYLKISATTYSGAPKLFDAVVVVKPWVDTKELLNFAPSPSTKIKQFW